MKKSNMLCLALSIILCVSVLCGAPAYAANETETAADYLVERGIFVGDENGRLNLDKGLTRAELAVILTRLDFADAPGGLAEWNDWGVRHFADPENRYNKFTDVPDWALPFVEYCYQRGLMKGTAAALFDAQGAVNSKMACTVILRYCGFAETDWEYDTSVEKARLVGLAPNTGVDGDVILRGTMAIIIRRGMDYDGAGIATVPPVPPPQETTAQSETPSMTIDEMKAEIVRLTNEERAKAGLPALEVLPELMTCAQAKAQDFIDNHYYGHTSPRYGTAIEMIRSFVPDAGWVAENIAPWYKTVAEMFAVGVESPSHYANMINANFTHIGVGIAEGTDGGYWWVQQFVSIA